MNALSTTRSLHPIQWVAAVAVTLFAITGIGAITGLIPTSKSAETSAMQTPVEQPIAAAPLVPPVPSVADATPPQPAPKVVVKHAAPVVHHRPTQIARADTERTVTPPPPPVICDDCGRIESVQRIEHEGQGSGAGAVAGGVLGGVLGHNVGDGNGRKVATIAGLIGGAMLGNHVEKAQKKTFDYQTTVRFEDGTSRVFNSGNEPSWQDGQRVRLVNGELRPI
jgi:outer membrane lipoprotein SlyB